MISLKSDSADKVNAERPQPFSYGLAILVVGIALLLNQLALSLFGSIGYAPFYAAVAISAGYGSVRAGLLATVLSTLGIDYFFSEPIYSLVIATLHDLIQLSGFTLVTVLISLNGRWRSTKPLQNSSSRLTAETSVEECLRLENELRVKEEELCIITEALPVLVAYVDSHQRYRFNNQTYEEWIGLPTDEICGKPVREIVGETVYQTIQPYIETALSGQQASYESKVTLTNGSTRYISATYIPQVREGKVDGFVALISDITKRKQAEAELRASEERFRNTFEQAAVGIAHVALDGSWLKVNQKLCEIVGYPREELLEKTFQEITYPDDLEADLEYLHQTLAGAISTYSMEKRYIRKDGSTVWINLTVSLAREKTGEPDYFISVVEDISDRKQAEAALRESRARLSFSLDAAQMGDWDLDLTTKAANRSRRHDQIFGYETFLPEWSYEIFLEHVLPEDRELVNQKFQRTLATYEDWDFECRIIRADKQMRWIWARGSVYRQSDGTPTHLLGIVADITERKEAEAEIRQLNENLEQRVKERTAQLEAANQELEAFSYSVSHDLRAPLRHISGFVELLQKRIDAEALGETGGRYLKIIAEATEKAGVLIDDLLALSRVGRAEMRYTEVDMNQLVKEVQRDLTATTKARDICWQIEPLPGVQGDPALLRQVWQNLLSNAIKYTRPRSSAEIAVGSTAKEGEAVFFVRDNGVGFNMQYAHKLFGVFQRLHSDRDFEGTGIGLANVQRIIHRHGGRVWAEGEVDRGATFYFSLPKSERKD